MIPTELLEDYLIDQEDGLKKLLTWFLNLVMQFEAMEQIDAEPYQRVGSRKAYRNGYKERSLKTRVGELKLRKPQFREKSFETKVFDRYSRVEKALINAIIESYLRGSQPGGSKILAPDWELKIYQPQVFPGMPRSWMRRWKSFSKDLSNIRFIIFL
jgi:transposase-like protein